MDNRTFNVSGLTGNNQNLNFGDQGTIQQNIQMTDNRVDELLAELKKFVSENSDERDLKAVEAIEENVKSGKLDTAKTFFGFLSKVVTTSAAGANIAKAFGWL